MTRSIHSVLGALFLALAACSAQSAAHHTGRTGRPPRWSWTASGATTRPSRPPRPSPRRTSTRACASSTPSTTSRPSRRSARRRASIRRARCATGASPSPTGSNYNSPTDAAREKAAYAAIQEAMRLADRVTPRERANIEALAKRHSAAPDAERAALDRAYADAMREVAQRFPEDLDAATLFADALMNLRPWNLWKPDGSMQPETPEILATLERVLRANPDHPGALHLYIHAVEAGPDPRRGEAAADRLRAAHAGRRPHRPHALPHLLARRSLRGRRRRERSRGEGGPGLLRQAEREPDLPRALLSRTTSTSSGSRPAWRAGPRTRSGPLASSPSPRRPP